MADRTLLNELHVAKAEVQRLEHAIAHASCVEVGHDWRFAGARNAACSRGDYCACSVPVNECARCGDCDYGDNDAASEIISDCLAEIDP